MANKTTKTSKKYLIKKPQLLNNGGILNLSNKQKQSAQDFGMGALDLGLETSGIGATTSALTGRSPSQLMGYQYQTPQGQQFNKYNTQAIGIGHQLAPVAGGIAAQSMGIPAPLGAATVSGVQGMSNQFIPQDPNQQVPQYKSGGWIGKAVNPAHKGYCTPMTKSTCTPHRKAFAMTMKKHHGFHKKVDGGEIDVFNGYMENGGLMEFKGPSHEDGGIPLYQQGQQVAEVEGNETMTQPENGEQPFVFSDKLTIPGTKTTFAKASKKYSNDGVNDSIRKKSNEMMLDRLQEQNQSLIDEKETKTANRLMKRYGGVIAKYCMGGKMKYADGGGIPQGLFPESEPAWKNVQPNTEDVGTYQNPPVNYSGIANSALELTPALYNASMAIKKQNYLPESKYNVNGRLTPQTINQQPLINQANQTYRQADYNARNYGGNQSTGQYMAGNYTNQANRMNTLSNIDMQSQMYNNQNAMSANQFNLGLDQNNKQMEFQVMDYNNRLKGAKQNFGAAAATNAGQYGAHNNQYSMVDKQMTNQQASQDAWMKAMQGVYPGFDYTNGQWVPKTTK